MAGKQQHNKPIRKPLQSKVAISRKSRFVAVVGKGPYFVTMHRKCKLVTVCKEYTHPRSRREAEPACGIQDNIRIGRELNVVVRQAHGRCSIEVENCTRIDIRGLLFVVDSTNMSRKYWKWSVRILITSTDFPPSRGRPWPKELVSPRTPAKARPPTSRSDITHLSRVSLEPAQRAQGDLVRHNESQKALLTPKPKLIPVRAPPTRPGQRYIGVHHRKWNTVRTCEQVDDSVLPASKRITTILRHHCKLREPDGAVSRMVLMEIIPDFDQTNEQLIFYRMTLLFIIWIGQSGFEYDLDSTGNAQY